MSPSHGAHTHCPQCGDQRSLMGSLLAEPSRASRRNCELRALSRYVGPERTPPAVTWAGDEGGCARRAPRLVGGESASELDMNHVMHRDPPVGDVQLPATSPVEVTISSQSVTIR
jgi:hypothetical protein